MKDDIDIFDCHLQSRFVTDVTEEHPQLVAVFLVLPFEMKEALLVVVENSDSRGILFKTLFDDPGADRTTAASNENFLPLE